MATQAGPKQQAEGLRKSYISTKPSPKGGYNGVWENPVANAPGCGFFTISRASILVQRSPLVMPGSPFSSWLLRSSCWATFSRQSLLIRVASNRSGSTQNLAHTPRKIEHLRKSSRSSDSREKVLPLAGGLLLTAAWRGKATDTLEVFFPWQYSMIATTLGRSSFFRVSLDFSTSRSLSTALGRS